MMKIQKNIINKWRKFITVLKWLSRERELEVDGIKYRITEEGNIVRMYNENKGVELPKLSHIWGLVEK